MNTINFNEIQGTLSQTINALIKLGYSHDFNIVDECLVCSKINHELLPEEFQIDFIYRFEGDSDPEYQSILYAISSSKYQLKGTLVNGYGTSSDPAMAQIIEKLSVHQDAAINPYKSNNPTPQRPEGGRVLHGPLVEMNLNAVIDQIKNEITWTESDRNAVTLYKSDTMRIVMIGLHENAELKPHKSTGVISVQVVEGKIEFATDDQSIELDNGQMIALQENIMHSVKALSESFFLLTLVIPAK